MTGVSQIEPASMEDIRAGEPRRVEAFAGAPTRGPIGPDKADEGWLRSCEPPMGPMKP